MATGDLSKDQVSADIYDVATRYLYLVRQLVLYNNVSDLNTLAQGEIFDPSLEGGTAYISMIQTLSNLYKTDHTITETTMPAVLAEKQQLEETLIAFFGYYSNITSITFPTNEQVSFKSGSILVSYDPELDNIYNAKDWNSESDPMTYGGRIIESDLPYIPEYKIFQNITNIRDTIGAAMNVYHNDLLVGAKIVGYIGLNKTLYDVVEDNVPFNPNTGNINFSSVGGLFPGDKILIMVTIGLDETTTPMPQEPISYFRKKEVFTGGTNLTLTLQHEILDLEEPQIFFNGTLLVDADYIVSTNVANVTTVTLRNISRELGDTIIIFYIANII